MTMLKSLKFTAEPKVGAKPVIKSRTKLIARLEEQKQLLADPSFTRTTQKWAGKGAERTMVEKRQRVTPWWQLDQSGTYVFLVRVGRKPIEFEKGKPAIAVPSLDKLPSIIDTLITAVRNGELDEHLGQSAKPKVAAAARKAA